MTHKSLIKCTGAVLAVLALAVGISIASSSIATAGEYNKSFSCSVLEAI